MGDPRRSLKAPQGLMREHGVAHVWTNDRDFRKFDDIHVLSPFDSKYSTGFE